jgi:hypothetical protein
MKRSCIVHIGPHKTGSTSIQKMLADNDGWVRNFGLYVPRTGRAFGQGHHLLAWELNRRAGFSGSEQFDALSHELANANYPDRIVLSSEEFSSRIHLPKVIARLRRKVERLDYQLRIVGYIRPQETAVQSMYTQRLKIWAVTSDFDTFWPTAIGNRRLNYEKRFAALLEARNIQVNMYPFCRDTVGQGLCRHFLSVLGIPPDALANFIEPPPSNVSPGPKTVAAAIAIARELEKRELRVNKENLEAGALLFRGFSKLIDADSSKFSALTPDIAQHIRGHFRESNARFAARVFDCDWDRVFAAELASEPRLNVFLRACAAPEEQREFDHFVATMTEAIVKFWADEGKVPNSPVLASGH